MKVYQAWYETNPSTVDGYSVVVTYRYTSFDKAEMDSFKNSLPKGVVITEFKTENRDGWEVKRNDAE